MIVMGSVDIMMKDEFFNFFHECQLSIYFNLVCILHHLVIAVVTV